MCYITKVVYNMLYNTSQPSRCIMIVQPLRRYSRLAQVCSRFADTAATLKQPLCTSLQYSRFADTAATQIQLLCRYSSYADTAASPIQPLRACQDLSFLATAVAATLDYCVPPPPPHWAPERHRRCCAVPLRPRRRRTV